MMQDDESLDGYCGANPNAAREVMLRRLYRLHRLHVGAPLGDRSDDIPTTRGDLRELYSAILDGTVARPAWAIDDRERE
jgi:hypothetical protein